MDIDNNKLLLKIIKNINFLNKNKCKKNKKPSLGIIHSDGFLDELFLGADLSTRCTIIIIFCGWCGVFLTFFDHGNRCVGQACPPERHQGGKQQQMQNNY